MNAHGTDGRARSPGGGSLAWASLVVSCVPVGKRPGVVTCSDHGAAALHWVGPAGSRRWLAVWLGHGKVEYTKQWGAGLQTQVASGDITDIAELEALADWCLDGAPSPAFCECPEPYIGARSARLPAGCERCGQFLRDGHALDGPRWIR